MKKEIQIWSCYNSDLPHCCGIRELGEFESAMSGSYDPKYEKLEEYLENWYCEKNEDTSPEKLLRRALKNCGKRLVLLNFVKLRGNSVFCNDNIRQVTMRCNQAIHIGTFNNPNHPGNIIDSWAIQAYKKVTFKREKKKVK